MPSQRQNIFHLGKRAYTIALDENQDILLFGTTKWNPTRTECRLEMLYAIVPTGTAIDLAEVSASNKKTLFVYSARSGKFKNGEFSDFDARRYIKSRYRTFTRELNRHQSPESKMTLLQNQAREFENSTNPHQTRVEIVEREESEQPAEMAVV